MYTTYYNCTKYRNGFIKKAKEVEIKFNHGDETVQTNKYTDVKYSKNGATKKAEELSIVYNNDPLLSEVIDTNILFNQNGEVSIDSRKLKFKDNNEFNIISQEIQGLIIDNEDIISKCSYFETEFQPNAPLSKQEMINAKYNKTDNLFEAEKLTQHWNQDLVDEMITPQNYLISVNAQHIVNIYPKNSETQITMDKFINRPLHYPEGGKIADKQYKMTLQELDDGTIPTFTNPKLDENGNPEYTDCLSIYYKNVSNCPVEKEMFYELQYNDQGKESAKKYTIDYKDNVSGIKKDEWFNPKFNDKGMVVEADKYIIHYLDNGELKTKEINNPKYDSNGNIIS